MTTSPVSDHARPSDRTDPASGANVNPTLAPEPPVVVPPEPHEAIEAACARIAPLWPLESFVAVNPYLGLADHTFAEAAERLSAVAGANTTLPLSHYLDAIGSGRITLDDVEAALELHDPASAGDAAGFLAGLRSTAAGPDVGTDDGADVRRVPTVARVATQVTGQDWARLTVDRVSAWAAAYFDQGQCIWRSADASLPLFTAWREEASVDRTPEVMGLRGFRATVRSLPADPMDASQAVLLELGVPPHARELYLHALLLQVGGWSAHAARSVWEAGLRGEQDDTLAQFLAVLLAWELGIRRSLGDGGVAAAWRSARQDLAELGDRPPARGSLAARIVLQDALDRAEHRRLVRQFATHSVAGAASPSGPEPVRPRAQAVFCIDVRSEVLRRRLEAVAGDVATIGFAGFFGFPVEFVPLAHNRGEAQCPVLLTPSHTVAESVPDPERLTQAVEGRRLRHHVRRAWKSFKMGAISCFSFVGPVGLIYLPKLFTDSAGATRPVPRPDDEALGRWAADHRSPTLDPVRSSGPTVDGIPLADRIAMAEGALRGMSLTSGFAPLVLVAGHGATTVNNPYDTGLDCGACGGHTGEANARVAVAILNDPEVRAALAGRGIAIPDDTWFVAGLHDTTTDELSLFDRGAVPTTHAAALDALAADLARAGRLSRAERAPRLGIDEGAPVDAQVMRRSNDWAQVRPEWGLAGCRTFVVAPRDRTAGMDLGGRSFLHSYDWRADEGFGVLELVMTAPMVVASWISLQYYASTVDNELFGSGNKVLHNVVGRLGVLEGNAGDLRVGLPWQSVHDGEGLQHEPLRLSVVIEAPTDAMTDVLARHDGVRDLVDNGWLHLFALGEDGAISHRYAGGLRWEPVAA